LIPILDFAEGELVRVRTWDSLAEEYGISNDGSIWSTDVDNFVPDMSQFSGLVFRVDHIDDDGELIPNADDVREKVPDPEDFDMYFWHKSFFEPVTESSEPEFKPTDFSDFKHVLGV